MVSQWLTNSKKKEREKCGEVRGDEDGKPKGILANVRNFRLRCAKPKSI